LETKESYDSYGLAVLSAVILKIGIYSTKKCAVQLRHQEAPFTVIFNSCAHRRKFTDFRLFYSDPTRKCCKTARNCHFALHHHAIANFEDILDASSFLPPSFAIAPRLKKHNATTIDRILREHFKDDYYKIAATYLITYNIVIKRRRKIQIKEAIGHLYKARKARFSSKAILEVKDFVRRLLEDDSNLY
jgi:hypothetical protein